MDGVYHSTAVLLLLLLEERGYDNSSSSGAPEEGERGRKITGKRKKEVHFISPRIGVRNSILVGDEKKNTP